MEEEKNSERKHAELRTRTIEEVHLSDFSLLDGSLSKGDAPKSRDPTRPGSLGRAEKTPKIRSDAKLVGSVGGWQNRWH